MKQPLLDSIRFDIKDALESIGLSMNDERGYRIYPLGVVIELNPAVCSQDDIPQIEKYLCDVLRRNKHAFRLEIVPENPLENQAAIIQTELPKNQRFRVRRQSFAEVFANHLRREGFIKGNRLVKRVRVKFHKATCEKISGHSVDDSFFQSALENYSQDRGYKIEEDAVPLDRGYALSELEEVPVKLRGGSSLDVTPFEIRNPTRAVIHFDIHSLHFSPIKGVALLPGQTLKVVQKLDVETIKRQIEQPSESNEQQKDVYAITLPDSEFDLLPRRSIIFKPLSLPFRPRTRTRLFPSEEEKYQLLYVGARMRSLRTEIYVSNLFDPDFDPPLAIAVGYTQADGMRWYAFNQPCELHGAESFGILPGYLFKADFDQFRIRNIHLMFRASQADRDAEARSHCEILLESSEQETLLLMQKPKPVVVAAFSEHDAPDIRLGKDRFQLRISRSYRRRVLSIETESTGEQAAQGLRTRALLDSEAVLNIREGAGLSNKPWKSIALDEPFIIGNHILRVSTD